MSLLNGEGAPHCFDSGDAQECVGWRARQPFNKPGQTGTQVYALHYGRSRAVVVVVPDAVWSGMWRIRWPDGALSDVTNIARARDAAASIAERGPPPRNRRRFRWEIERSKTPSGAGYVRQNGGGL